MLKVPTPKLEAILFATSLNPQLNICGLPPQTQVSACSKTARRRSQIQVVTLVLTRNQIPDAQDQSHGSREIEEDAAVGAHWYVIAYSQLDQAQRKQMADDDQGECLQALELESMRAQRPPDTYQAERAPHEERPRNLTGVLAPTTRSYKRP